MRYTCPTCHKSFTVRDGEEDWTCPNCGQGLTKPTRSNAGGCLSPVIKMALALGILAALGVFWKNISDLEALRHYGPKIYGRNIASFWKSGGLAVSELGPLEVFEKPAAPGAAKPKFLLKPGEAFLVRGYYRDEEAKSTWMAAEWWDKAEPVYGFVRLPEAAKDPRESKYLVRNIDHITTPIYERRYAAFLAAVKDVAKPVEPADARAELKLMVDKKYFKAWDSGGKGFYLPKEMKKAVDAFREAMIGKDALRILYYQRSPGYDPPIPDLKL